MKKKFHFFRDLLIPVIGITFAPSAMALLLDYPLGKEDFTALSSFWQFVVKAALICLPILIILAINWYMAIGDREEQERKNKEQDEQIAKLKSDMAKLAKENERLDTSLKFHAKNFDARIKTIVDGQ